MTMCEQAPVGESNKIPSDGIEQSLGEKTCYICKRKIEAGEWMVRLNLFRSGDLHKHLGGECPK